MNLKELLNEVKDILNKNKIESFENESKLILSHFLSINLKQLICNYENEILEQQYVNIINAVNKRSSGIPLAYIINTQPFMYWDFYVNENVLIPRPDTEILVEESVKLIKSKNSQNIKVLDLCCGSGCIGLSIAKLCDNANVLLVDINEKSLDVAQINCHKLNITNVRFLKSDMFKNINEKFDFIISNPPYIKTKIINDLEKDVQMEPYIALDGGKDGLDFYKSIARNYKQYLNNKGNIILEIGYDQKDDVIDLFNGKFSKCECLKDYGNNDRVLIFG